MKITLIYPNLQRLPIPNIGLAYLISALETKHKVSLIDLTFHSFNYSRYLIKKLEENPPDVVGISVTTFTFSVGLKIASMIKQIYPKVTIIFGGIHPTLLPEEVIAYPEIDAVCIGEGEEAFLEYLDCLQKDFPPKGVAGVWYKEDSQIIRNPLRPFKEDLDSFPFPNWDHWEIERYMMTSGYFPGGLPVLASRGCPYNCSFCSTPAIQRAVPGKYYRLRSAQNIVDEIKLNKAKYYRSGFQSVTFVDETFGRDNKQMENFCNLYIENKLNKDIFWACQIRADIMTESWVKKASKAGCVMTSFGIESGDDDIRIKVYKKNIGREQILKAVKLLQKNDIVYQVSFMIGCPGETKKSIIKSIKLLKEVKPVISYFFFYQPLPKTELAMLAAREAELNDKNFYKYHHRPRINMSTLKISDLKRAMWIIRIQMIYSFFIQGLRLKGLIFILDIIKYILLIGNPRVTFLFNSYTRVELQQRTINKYILEKKRKRHYENSVYQS